jgi:hypothetical protein
MSYVKRVEAWNNIVAFLKFISNEEYIKNKTVNDIMESLDVLTPTKTEHEEVKIESCKEEKNNAIGFTSNEQ